MKKGRVLDKEAMKNLKPILVVVALLATMLPCGHAAVHHDHHHDADMGLCEVAVDPCSCHSCGDRPCVGKVEIQTDRTSDTTPIEQPPISFVLFILPETNSALRQARPPSFGMLAALQTVQLLI